MGRLGGGLTDTIAQVLAKTGVARTILYRHPPGPTPGRCGHGQ